MKINHPHIDWLEEKFLVGIKGWRIARRRWLGWLRSIILGTVKLGLWGVSKVCLVLLFLTLNLLLLCQNLFLLLQERHVNENAVDEYLSFTIWNWRERKKMNRKVGMERDCQRQHFRPLTKSSLKVSSIPTFSSLIIYFFCGTFKILIKFSSHQCGSLRKMHRKMFERNQNGENVKRDESGEKMKLKPIITNFNRISFSYAFKRKVLSDFHKFKLWT